MNAETVFLRCQVTDNRCGTDTRPVGSPCTCRPCRLWLRAFEEGKATSRDLVLEEAARAIEAWAAEDKAHGARSTAHDVWCVAQNVRALKSHPPPVGDATSIKHCRSCGGEFPVTMNECPGCQDAEGGYPLKPGPSPVGDTEARAIAEGRRLERRSIVRWLRDSALTFMRRASEASMSASGRRAFINGAQEWGDLADRIEAGDHISTPPVSEPGGGKREP